MAGSLSARRGLHIGVKCTTECLQGTVQVSCERADFPTQAKGRLEWATGQLSRFRVQHRNLLVACMQITSYNHHRSAPFLRALVALSASKSTRPRGADMVISSAR